MDKPSSDLRSLTRREFVRLAGAALATGLAPALAFGNGFDQLRGDRVGWARLKTPSPDWRRHAGSDPTLTRFFRDETTLNIDRIWYVADAISLDELCKYPLLFSQGVAAITDESARGNIAEYIRRGGFVLVDACHDPKVTPDYEAFLAHQIAFYSAVLPGATITELPVGHEIYRCHFQIPDGRPPYTFAGNIYDPRKAAHGLYAVMLGSRMAGIIGLCGWQCGWDRVTEHLSHSPPGTDVACMRMVVNIYIYAMMQGA